MKAIKAQKYQHAMYTAVGKASSKTSVLVSSMHCVWRSGNVLKLTNVYLKCLHAAGETFVKFQTGSCTCM